MKQYVKEGTELTLFLTFAENEDIWILAASPEIALANTHTNERDGINN
jgi:hypothetical protein